MFELAGGWSASRSVDWVEERIGSGPESGVQAGQNRGPRRSRPLRLRLPVPNRLRGHSHERRNCDMITTPQRSGVAGTGQIRGGVVSLCASAAGWVQMRCRECAAEVAVTARVCPGCGAPIVGQPPVVADTVVADAVVAAVSDAAGEAVPSGVAGQALPEPYVPGSGDRLPAEFRLVLAGHVGKAAGLFATALACAAAICLVGGFSDDLGEWCFS